MLSKLLSLSTTGEYITHNQQICQVLVWHGENGVWDLGIRGIQTKAGVMVGNVCASLQGLL